MYIILPYFCHTYGFMSVGNKEKNIHEQLEIFLLFFAKGGSLIFNNMRDGKNYYKGNMLDKYLVA